MFTATQTINLLLVDDDPSAAGAEHGFQGGPACVQLKVAGDGIEAYRYISGAGSYADRAAHPLPDVILLDINIPGLTGLQFLRWLREQAPADNRDIPVIIISAPEASAELAWADALGVYSFLLKPVKWSEFWKDLLSSGLLQSTAT